MTADQLGTSCPPGAFRAVFLAGFMGSGKSTIGVRLAKVLAWPFVDMDAEIERSAGCTIPEIFARHGEARFRAWEHTVIRSQVEPSELGPRRVVALGGGAYTSEHNRSLLRQAGPTLWLDAPVETLWERVQRESHRPLARDRAEFMRIYELRKACYAHAEHRIDASADPAKVLHRILGLGWMQELCADG